MTVTVSRVPVTMVPDVCRTSSGPVERVTGTVTVSELTDSRGDRIRVTPVGIYLVGVYVRITVTAEGEPTTVSGSCGVVTRLPLHGSVVRPC